MNEKKKIHNFTLKLGITPSKEKCGGDDLENKSWPLIPFCVILDHDLSHPITSKLLGFTLYWIEGLVEVEEKSFPLDKGGGVNMLWCWRVWRERTRVLFVLGYDGCRRGLMEMGEKMAEKARESVWQGKAGKMVER
nr:hypothetical protein [Tanacetum cinerariifolium]